MKNVFVIGAGAAGMVAAIEASRNNKVTIIEKNNSVGKKILITGNGRCNYFNDDFQAKHYSSTNGELLAKFINEVNKRKVISFFDSLGIIPKIKDGYYYPYSNQAVSIQNVLLTELKVNKVSLKNNETVQNIKFQNNHFFIKTDQNSYKADCVVLATGSKAYYDDTNSDIGYNIAASFGHTIIPVLPGLVQLKAQGNFFKEWSGIRCEAKCALYIENKLIKEETGEIQLTNYGLSGICIMQLSNYANSAIFKKNAVDIRINFLNCLNINDEFDFIEFIKNRNELLKMRNISELFDGILNYKLVNLILKLANIKNTIEVKDLSDSKLLELGQKLTTFSLKITDYNSFKEAQICLGGVALNEVNLETFESLKQKGLYIVGELLDVNGECGGYNLGFAWLSGILAGSSIND